MHAFRRLGIALLTAGSLAGLAACGGTVSTTSSSGSASLSVSIAPSAKPATAAGAAVSKPATGALSSGAAKPAAS